MAGLIRVAALVASRRRAGFAFDRDGLVIGPESFERGIAALQQLAALLSDPLLVVTLADDDTPDVFRPLSDDEREAIVEAAAAAAEQDDPDAAEAAADAIFTAIVGERAVPVDPAAQERAARLAEKMAAERPIEGAGLTPGGGDFSTARVEPVPPAAGETKPGVEAAPTKEEASKGDPAPAPVKTAADAKPGSSSGRKPRAAAANTKAAQG